MLYRKYAVDPIYQGISELTVGCKKRVLAENPRFRCFLCDIADKSFYNNHEALIKNPIVIVTNSVLQGYGDYVNDYVEKVNDSFYGIFYRAYNWSDVPVTKDYNCFINRIDPIRQSWFYQLIRHNLLDRGCVSFNMTLVDGTGPLMNFENTEPKEVFETLFDRHLQIFSSEHAIAKNIVPFKNFMDTGDLADTIMTTKISIILETYAAEDAITYSEKTFRCLQLPRLWLLNGSPNCVNELRKMGFDVLDDLIDHNSYDGLLEVPRQAVMLQLIKELIDIDLIKIKPRLEEAALHNQELLRKWNATWQQDFENTISQAKTKLEKLLEHVAT
jgi:hypothetical protein